MDVPLMNVFVKVSKGTETTMSGVRQANINMHVSAYQHNDYAKRI